MVDTPKRRQGDVHSLQFTICPECGSDHLIRDFNSAEVACADCGLVLTEKMVDKGPEWRAFDAEQRAQRRRVGGRITFTIHDKGLATLIDQRNRDAFGRALTPRRRAQFFRMRKWQRRARLSDSIERNLAVALGNMSKMGASLHVPNDVLETASIIYRKALRRRLIRGRSIQGVGAACVYMACRQCGVARTLSETAAASGIDRKDLGRAYRFLRNRLRESVPLTSPAPYISRVANHLELTGSAETLALRLIDAAQRAHLTMGKGPISIAASAVYLASILVDDRRTQRMIAQTMNVTEVTVRNRYKDLIENLDITIQL